MKRFTLLLFIFPLLLSAQSPLQQGFNLMEKGEFGEATVFFQDYLQKVDKNDKTALLCYGRAVGLGGDVAKAQETFQALLQAYPADYEVTLNLGESYLWEKQAPKARVIYEQLVARDSNNFVALLGLANTYAALKEYEKSAVTIEKALKQDNPNKQNAKVSKKYILLALADTEMKNRELKKSKAIIENLLVLYPNDKDVLLLAATIELVSEKFARAKDYFSQAIVADSLIASQAYLGISYSEFMLKKSSKALKTSELAISSAKDKTQLLNAYIGKVNALGWNKKFKEAFILLDTLAVQYPQKWEVQSAVARLRVWNNQAKKGIEVYEQLVANDSLQREVIAGYVDALIANGWEKRALVEIDKQLLRFPDFYDLKKMQRKVQLNNSLQVKTQAYMSSDNGNNISQNLKTDIQLPSNGKFKPVLKVNIRKIADNDASQSAVTQIAVGGIFKINNRLTSNVYVGLFSAKTTHNTFSQPFVDLSINKKMGKRQSIELGIKKDMQTYNSALVNQQLKSLDLRLMYATQSAKRLGLYTENIWSKYSDANTRFLSFASFYVNLKNEPTIKTGINATCLTFHNQVSSQYFSPKKYMSAELFIQSENMQVPSAKLLYQVNVAVGKQKIEDFSAQNMYRVNAKLGYRWADWGYCAAYFLRSNSVTTNALGYRYNEIGVECNIHFLKKK